jgi:uncharacterized protein
MNRLKPASLQTQQTQAADPRIVLQSTIMQRLEAIRLLKEHESQLKQLGVLHLFLFGSTARNDAGPDSDVDLFFDYTRGKLSLYGLMDIKEVVRGILSRPTDIMTRSSLHPALRAAIEASAVRVF